MLNIINDSSGININANIMLDDNNKMADIIGVYKPEVTHPSMYLKLEFGNPFLLDDGLNKQIVMKDIEQFLTIVYDYYKQAHS